MTDAEREQQIAEVEEEIAWLRKMIETGAYIFGNEKILERLGAVEQDRLKALNVGMVAK